MMMTAAFCGYDLLIEAYKEAVKETKRVLKSGGKFLAMLLNPQSEFFKEKTKIVSEVVHALPE